MLRLRLLAPLLVIAALAVPDFASVRLVQGQQPAPVEKRDEQPASGATRPAPANNSFDAIVDEAAAPAERVPDWALTKGSARVAKASPEAEGFAVLDADEATIVSSAFTLTSKAHELSFDSQFSGLVPDKETSVQVFVLSGDAFQKETLVSTEACKCEKDWTTVYVDVSGWAGQTIKLKFVRGKDSGGSVNLDNIGSNLLAALLGPDQKSIRVADPINTSTGNFTISDVDFTLPGLLPVVVGRTYNSDSTYMGPFGKGWTSVFSMQTVGNDVLYPDGFLGQKVGDSENCSSSSTSCTLTTHDQVVYTFNNTGSFFGYLTLASIQTEMGTMTRNYSGSSETWTTPAGTLTITRNSTTKRITSIAGPGFALAEYTYDSSGYLTAVDTPSGRTSYAYSGGRMVTSTDNENHTTFTNVYTSSGQVKKQTDAVGNVTCLYHGADYETTTGCSGVSPVPTSGKTVVVDPRGKKTTYDYDTDFRTTQIKDTLNGLVNYTYDGDDNVTCVTDQLGHKTGFSYDTKRNITQMRDPLNTDSNCALKSGGVKWTFTYTTTNKLDLTTDPLGRKVDNIYSSGKLTEVQVKNASNSIKARTCFAYVSGTFKVETETQSTTLTNCTGNTTKFEYTGNQLTAVIDPRYVGQPTPPKTVYEYYSTGLLKKVTDEAGFSTTSTYAYNGVLGPLVTSTDPYGSLTRLDYPTDKVIGTDAEGNVTTQNYDAANRLTSVVDAMNETTSYAYDGNGNMTSFTNARGKVTTMTYDDLNRLATTTDPDNRTTTFQYDAASNLTQRTDARGLVTKYFYDAADRLTSIEHWTSGGGSLVDTTSYQYDAVGNRTQVTDTTGTTTYVYDTLDRLTTVTFPGSKVVSYTYDNVGTLARITYPDSKYVDYDYDAGNRLTTVTDWLSKVTSYTYDTVGRLTTTTLPSSTGVVSTRTYDNASRLTKVENKQGSTVLSSFQYQLDRAGARIGMVTPAGSQRYDYDPLYRLTAELPGTPAYTFAGDNFESGTTSGGFGWTNNWTLGGLLQPIMDQGAMFLTPLSSSATRIANIAGQANATIDFRANVMALTGSDQAKVEASTNGSSWTAVKTFTSADADATFHDYSVDISSFLGGSSLYVRLSISSSTGTAYWIVDSVELHTNGTVTGSGDSYTYDEVGNRLTKNSTSYTYSNADLMTLAGGVSYGYDNNGNQTSRGSDTFTWDHENRLKTASMGTSSYVYNSDGLRTSRTSGGSTSNYIWDVNRGVPVILQDGDYTYVYGLGLISMTDNSGVQTYRMMDGLGSTVGLCSGSGTLLDTYVYDAFGIIKSQTGSTNDYFLYTGEQRDSESGYDYLRARYYDSAIGRFLGRDVASPDWKVPDSINRFAYVKNNPMTLVDPTGRYWVCPNDDCANGFESTEAGLPADPPSYCDVGGNYCVWDSGVIYPYNDPGKGPGNPTQPIGYVECQSLNAPGGSCDDVSVCSPVGIDGHCEHALGQQALETCAAIHACPRKLQADRLPTAINQDATRHCVGYGGDASAVFVQGCGGSGCPGISVGGEYGYVWGNKDQVSGIEVPWCQFD